MASSAHSSNIAQAFAYLSHLWVDTPATISCVGRQKRALSCLARQKRVPGQGEGGLTVSDSFDELVGVCALLCEDSSLNLMGGGMEVNPRRKHRRTVLELSY